MVPSVAPRESARKYEQNTQKQLFHRSDPLQLLFMDDPRTIPTKKPAPIRSIKSLPKVNKGMTENDCDAVRMSKEMSKQCITLLSRQYTVLFK